MQRQIVYQAFYKEIVGSEYSCTGMDAGRKMIKTSFRDLFRLLLGMIGRERLD